MTFDFDDVERRNKTRKPPNGQEKRSMTHEDHHEICKESYTAFKEYVCLKLRPLSDKFDSFNLRFKAIWTILTIVLVAFVINGGLAYTQNSEAIKKADGNEREINHNAEKVGVLEDKFDIHIAEQRQVNTKILESLQKLTIDVEIIKKEVK